MRPSVSPPTRRGLAARGIAVAVAVAIAAPVGLATRSAAASPATAPAPAPTVGPTAAAPTAASPPAATVDPALEHARELYEEGRARFDTFDYEGAVQLWTKAYAKLPADADGIRNRMVYNIATAQQMAFDIDQDVQHLRQAVLLLEQYIRNYTALHEPGPQVTAEVAKADERIAALRARIDGPAEPTSPAEPDPSMPANARFGSGEIDGIVWTTDTGAPPDPEQLHRNRHLASEDRKTDRMLIGSYVALSVGGALTLAGTGATLGTRSASEAAQGGSVGTLALGLAGLAVGFTLLGIGVKRRKRAREGTLVAAPMIGPRLGGAAVQVRF